MILRRLCAIAFLCVIAVACDDGPTAPPGALIGRWAGAHAELVADARAVTVQFGCGPLKGTGPLVPDATGSFAYAVRSIAPVSSAVLTLVGHVANDVITFDAISITPYGSSTTRFVVSRNGTADFTSVACAALGL